tara:strand:- start:23 stop:535 length:513 start_codon:yes stop_codon:yes gene_type:complete
MGANPRYGTLALEITQTLKDLLTHRARIKGEGLSEYVGRVLSKHEDYSGNAKPQEREAAAFTEGEETGLRSEAARQWAALVAGWAAYEFDKVPYVYALLKGNEVLYVGKTCRLNWRISAHQTGKVIPFDSVRVMECASESAALQLELEGIRALRPRYNTAGNPNQGGNWE